MSEYTPLAKKWVEVTKRVAAGSWDGIVCLRMLMPMC